ncbi:MAG: hypothetical protein IJU94_06650 [Clostridia bacterium]|nr:hypothetical protein [Clostridia bacterium]
MKRITAFVVFACMALTLCACAPNKESGFVKLETGDLTDCSVSSLAVWGDEALILLYNYAGDGEGSYELRRWDLKRNRLINELQLAPGSGYGCSAAYDDDGVVIITEWRGEEKEVTTGYDRDFNKLDNYVPKKVDPEARYKALGVTDFWQDDYCAFYDGSNKRAMIFYDDPSRMYIVTTDYEYSAAEYGMKIAYCKDDEAKNSFCLTDFAAGGIINRSELSTVREGYYNSYGNQTVMNDKYVLVAMEFEERRDYPEPDPDPDSSSEEERSSEEESSSEESESGESSEEESSSASSEGAENESSESSGSSEPESSSERESAEDESAESDESSEQQPNASEDITELVGDEYGDGGEEDCEGEDCDCGYDGDYQELGTVVDIYVWDFTAGAYDTPDGGNVSVVNCDEIEAITKARADEIGEKYGVKVIVNPEDRTEENGIADLENNETFAPGYMNLDVLDETLGRFPEGIFTEMLNDGMFDEFRIYIAKRINDDFSAAYSNNGNGILYIALTTSFFNASNIAHEMMHSMEYRIRDIWSDWEKLNPRGFDYYGDTREANNSDFNENYFVRGYGQANQLEDRATIFEELFVSGMNEDLENWWYSDKPGVVAKAEFLCAEIRKAYPSVAAVDEAIWERPLNDISD